MLETMGFEADRHNKRKWFCKVAWSSWHRLDQAQTHRTSTKPAPSTWRKCRPWTTYPHRSSPPQRYQSHRSLSALRKIRQTWKAKAFDEMTRSTEKALREGTPCREEGGSAGCQCCSWSHSIGGGRTQEKWRKQIFNVQTFRGMASKGGSNKSY